MTFNNFVLFDDPTIRADLLPFTFTRPVADIRIGIRTIREKWEHALSATTFTSTEDYLSEKFPTKNSSNSLWINGAVLPNEEVLSTIENLQSGQTLVQDDLMIAAVSDSSQLETIKEQSQTTSYSGELLVIRNLWDIFTENGLAIEKDFTVISSGRSSEALNDTNQVIGKGNIFLDQGAKVNGAILNATKGPIYIGKEAEVMEGSIIRGPFALCDHSTTKMGAKIYGPTTVGPHSKVGGEINNSVIFGYSNKAHDGFLGNSVIGEWCNIGADSNNSNLKNNYAEVKLWNYPQGSFANTGQQFCGLFMGDHSKCGINTMFNTGTVVGVSANIFGSGFPRNFIPSFSWGGAKGFTTYKLEKAFEVAELMMSRRSKAFDDIEKNILSHVFELTKQYRS